MLNPEKWPEWMLRGRSAPAHRLRNQVDRVAPHYRVATVVGECGSLKVELARALHARSPFNAEAMTICHAREFHCSLLEERSPATVYVASAGELEPDRQASLRAWLRRGKRAQARLIFGTEVSPRGLAAGGRLHPELLNLIAAVEIRLAPLRERREDLPDLLEELEIAPEAMERLAGHGWPGNLRELQKVIASAAALAAGGAILAEHLPAFAGQPADEEQQSLKLDVVVRRHVVNVLESCAGNKLRAAEVLGISRSTLYRMLDSSLPGLPVR